MNSINDFFKKSAEDEFGFVYNQELNQKSKGLLFTVPAKFYPLTQRKGANKLEILQKFLILMKKFAKKKTDSNVNNAHDFNEEDTNILEAYISLYRDYLDNGDFFTFNHFYSSSRGKIDWKRSLKKDPLFFENTYFYIDSVRSVSRASDDNLFFLIYKKTMLSVFEVFDSGKYDDIEIEIPEEAFLSIINQFNDRNFSDRDRFISLILKKIYENKILKSKDNSLSSLKSVTTFSNIFEKMVDFFFKKEFSDSTKNVNIPGVKSKTIGYLLKKNNKSLEIDTLILYNNNFFLIDSKFYKDDIVATNMDNSSIHKQFLYYAILNRILKTYKSDSNLHNLFVLPTLNATESVTEDKTFWQLFDELFRMIANVQDKSKKDENKKIEKDLEEIFGKIRTLKLDFEFLMDYFVLDFFPEKYKEEIALKLNEIINNEEWKS